MKTLDTPLRGRCLCGDVRFRISGAVGDPIACHSQQSRRMSGHYWASISADPDELVLEKGETSLTWYEEGNSERGFCLICGSNLFWRPLEGPGTDRVAVSLGAIEGDTGLVLDTHINTSDKGDYYDIPEQAQSYPNDQQ